MIFTKLIFYVFLNISITTKPILIYYQSTYAFTNFKLLVYLILQNIDYKVVIKIKFSLMIHFYACLHLSIVSFDQRVTLFRNITVFLENQH